MEYIQHVEYTHTTSTHTTQREYYNLVKEGNIREALITMGVERAKDVSQANQLMNLRKVSTPYHLSLLM